MRASHASDRSHGTDGAHQHAADRWLRAVPCLALLHALLLFVLYRRPGLPAVVLWHIGPAALTIAAVLVMVYGLRRSTRARLTWTARRAAGFASLAAISAMPLTYGTYPSSRDRLPSQVRFRLPLDGPVTVRWGGPTRAVNYHAFAPPERWAYDLFVTQGQRSARGEGKQLTDYHAYGLPVLAPSAGAVRIVSDGAPDTPLGSRGGWRNACGNHVAIDVAPGEYLFLCHLQAGSIRVGPGDPVIAGQQIGRVGNSGRSTEPHLHVHLQTTLDVEFGEGIPLFFHGYRHEGHLVERGMPTGGRSPQTVEHGGS
ncbi:MAG TPA: M23 family metallopeptidase [Vicinamibacterales bacterium]|nr:M23 family metallopeptidase [Vicinamibacterales bacterium]